ncbi:MAG TPA: patatin-like phospholipase family protein [Sphingomonas sanguinis]|uniref:patatin-like phospholipase family protein n=1 Tax=Sphingomonas sanguinis TaxID=33051 RepID=UPI002AC16CA7|nr:patatin-like phospholipase family protein [Sphingomonas sanguinis]HJO64718.1 patatin-like phospholipase family protein [Sphingomonas sanguinis]
MTLPLPPDLRIALVLAGGNALGAYQAGVYEALHEAGISPDWVVGTSAGAINGAIIAGNDPSDRLSRLSDLWRPDTSGAAGAFAWEGGIDSWRRSGEVVATLFGGRRGLFAPLGTALAERDAPALYDTTPLAHTLARLVDFDRLNDARVRYMIQAVALDTGAEVVFDNKRGRITPDHVRASCAMPPAFPPVAVDGELYVDGGLAANLPLDPVLAEPGEAPLLCIAVDLLPLAGPRAPTIGGLISRTQDLVFAAQSRRTLTRWRDHYANAPEMAQASVTLVQLRYVEQQDEVAGKALDFSPRSVRARWDAGLCDARALVAALAAGAIPFGGRGLTSTTIAARHEPLAAHSGDTP